MSPWRARSLLARSLSPIHAPSGRPVSPQAASLGTLVLWLPAGLGPQATLAGGPGRRHRGLIALLPPSAPQLGFWPGLPSSASVPSSCRGTPHQATALGGSSSPTPSPCPQQLPAALSPPKCCMVPTGVLLLPPSPRKQPFHSVLTSVRAQLGSSVIQPCDKLDPSGRDRDGGGHGGGGKCVQAARLTSWLVQAPVRSWELGRLSKRLQSMLRSEPQSLCSTSSWSHPSQCHRTVTLWAEEGGFKSGVIRQRGEAAQWRPGRGGVR